MPTVIQVAVKGDTSYEVVPVQSTAPQKTYHGDKSGHRHWIHLKEYLLNARILHATKFKVLL